MVNYRFLVRFVEARRTAATVAHPRRFLGMFVTINSPARMQLLYSSLLLQLRCRFLLP
jgi:hypothetical protein